MTMKILFKALIASVLVAILLAFVSITIISGELSSVLAHPGFWALYAKSILWFFLAGFLASVLTVLLTLRKQVVISEEMR